MFILTGLLYLCVANIVSTKLPLQRLVITKMLIGYKNTSQVSTSLAAFDEQ
jgi:hypothetical protein